MEISLEELAQALEHSDVQQGFVDMKTGKVCLLDENIADEDAFEHAMKMEEEWDHYLPIPNTVDMEERGIMEAFAGRQRDDVKKRLEESLNGDGGIRRFRYQVRRLLLQPAWDRFKHTAYREIARDWCEENQIAYHAE